MKSGLDFFPLDVTLDTKFELIEAEFGLEGFAIVVKLFQMIYGQEGYYGEVNDEVVLLFSRRCGVGGNTVSEIISAAVRRGIFDKTLYEKYGILTSEGIQKRYFEAVKRREKVEVRKEYLLGNCYLNFKNVNISEKNVNISPENVNISEQSKESKVKESKVKRVSKFTPPTVDEVKAYCDERKNGIDPESFVSFYQSKNWYIGKNKMVDWKAAVRTWESKRKSEVTHQSYDLDKVKTQATAPLVYERKNK